MQWLNFIFHKIYWWKVQLCTSDKNGLCWCSFQNLDGSYEVYFSLQFKLKIENEKCMNVELHYLNISVMVIISVDRCAFLLFTRFIFWLKSFYCDCRNNTLQCLPCFYPSTLKINNIFSSNPTTLLKMATPVMRVKKILDHIAARTHISNIFVVFIRNE